MRMEVGSYTSVHVPTFDFYTYAEDESYIQTLRMQPDGGFPIGGAYNLAHDVYASGHFADYGVPRCRFTSLDGGQLGGVWISDGAVVHNSSFLYCDKPRFPDSFRTTLGAVNVSVAPNGQCYSSSQGQFVTYNAMVTRTTVTGAPALRGGAYLDVLEHETSRCI